MPGTLDLAGFRRAMEIFAEELRRHREEIDSLNVYPVPDGDTGTNMLLTQEAVVAALAPMAPDWGDAEEMRTVVSRASLMGARGNSGVILSQILRGICERLPEDGTFEPDQLASWAAEAGFRRVRVETEELVSSVFGWAVRTFEAEAPRELLGARWAGFAYRGWRSLYALDAATLYRLVPKSLFYNLLVYGEKRG